MEERENRLKKIEELRRRGIDPYPHKYVRTHTIGEVRTLFDRGLAPVQVGDKVKIAGRIMRLRRFGRAIFADLSDYSGSIQIHLALDKVGDKSLSIFSNFVDRGDIVGIEGDPFYTKTGEPTIECLDFVLLAKCIRPLPEKWKGLKDPEVIRRQRYLHLIMDVESRQLFAKRSRIISAIRRFLDERHFIELKTPILQPVYGGAEAKPFTTYHNTLDMSLYLRIAPELYLKRLVVGGFEKVYEICDNFRNEGIDALHNPEFTMMEVYWAYTDYNDMMTLTEELLSNIAQAACGTLTFRWKTKAGVSMDISLSPPYRRITMLEAVNETIKKETGEDLNLLEMKESDAADIARRLNVPLKPGASLDEIIKEIFEEKVERNLLQPTFVQDYPSKVCPLTKQHRSDRRLAERFELFIAGTEFANGFTELTDPKYQEEQFSLQASRRQHGEEEAHPFDRDYVVALEYGLPPTGGLGIGIDRVVMLLTGAEHIQDVIPFPIKRQM